VDGVSKTAFLTLRYLQQTGREVIVFAPDHAPHSIGSTRVIPLPSVSMRMAPESRLALPSPVVAQQIAAFKPDIIHLFSPALLSATGMLVGRQNRIPIIANYQTDLPAYARHYGMPVLSQLVNDWLRYVHNGCHLTLVPSTFTQRQLQAEGYHRLRRWGRGVNSRHFTPARRSDAMRAHLLNGRDPNALLCIYVGRLANEKRVELLLDVARTPGVALTIIGDGAKREELEQIFAGTGTHFTGYLYGDELAEAYASADVFLFTGASETFGQVVQEAMASGLPSVILNAGGTTDLVHEGVNGFLCDDHTESFEVAVRRLRDNPALRQRMGAEARRLAEANPWEVVLGQLEGLYSEALHINERFNRVFKPWPNIISLFRQFGTPAHARPHDLPDQRIS
jgi:glycosyltransferase involved in cell wall biosynthesis